MLLMRKYDEENSACLLSHPVRGAWIEIKNIIVLFSTIVSHPVRGAWIEIIFLQYAKVPSASHPVRGAWIEISSAFIQKSNLINRRTPSGVRGLKWFSKF